MKQSNNEKMLLHMRNITECIAAMLHSVTNIQTALYRGEFESTDINVKWMGDLVDRLRDSKAELMNWEQYVQDTIRITKSAKSNAFKD